MSGANTLTFTKIMLIARAIALFVVSFLSIDTMLQSVVETRGGSGYIKPFHSWNMAFTCAVSVIFFETIHNFVNAIRRLPWQILWLTFILITTVITFLTLPLADWIAERHERSLGEPFISDMGYGWYYWDDSGMGGDPIVGAYLIAFLWQPFILSCFLFGSAAIFALAARTGRTNDDWQTMTDHP